MSLHDDGEYILTCDVESPLPARLHADRKGWRRWPKWSKGTHFEITDGLWTIGMSVGDKSAKLTSRQRNMVTTALRPHVVPWSPSVPSEAVTYGTHGYVLDALFALGRITMDDVRAAKEVCAAMNAIHVGMREVSRATFSPPPVAVATPVTVPSPGELRIGDVIAHGGTLFAVKEVQGAREGWGPDVYYDWQCLTHTVIDKHRPNTEPVIGHVADMIADGLGALSRTLGGLASTASPIAPGSPLLGFDKDGRPVRAGCVLLSEEGTTRLLVTGPAPGNNDGPRASVKTLVGDAMSSCSLANDNSWTVTDVLGFDHDGNPVRTGNILRHMDEVGSRAPEVRRYLVTGPVAANSDGPCVSYRALLGDVPGFSYISLSKKTKWVVEDAPPVAPVVSTFVPTPSASTYAGDPFSLD